jgi:hypothetical protein
MKTTIIILDKTVPSAAPRILILEKSNSVNQNIIKEDVIPHLP